MEIFVFTPSVFEIWMPLILFFVFIYQPPLTRRDCVGARCSLEKMHCRVKCAIDFVVSCSYHFIGGVFFFLAYGSLCVVFFLYLVPS